MKVIRLTPENQDRQTQTIVKKIESPILGPTTIQIVPTSSFLRTSPDISNADVVVIHADSKLVEQCCRAVKSIRQTNIHLPIIVVLNEFNLKIASQLIELECDDVVVDDLSFSIEVQTRCQINIQRRCKLLSQSDKTVCKTLPGPGSKTFLQDSQSNTQMRLLARQIGIGTWRWNVETDEFAVSKQFANHNKEGAKTTFSTWLKNVDERDKRDVAAKFDNAIGQPLTDTKSSPQSNNNEIQVACRYQMTDGQKRWLMCCGEVLRNPDGLALEFIGVFIDITRQKLSELELDRVNNLVQNNNEELSQFAYAASHDLQEPLRKIASFGQLMEMECKDVLSDDGKIYLDYMTDAAARMQTLINDLIDLCRIPADAQELQMVDLNQAANAAIFNLSVAIEESNAQVSIDDLPTVKANYACTVQLLQNLIDNAIKYRSKFTPKITISSQLSSGVHIITVSDNGIGIDPKHHERIFGVFKRLHNSKEIAGTGVGLAISKRIVELSGGKIWVEANEPFGSRFSFSWPSA